MTIEAVERLEVLTPQQRDIIDAASSGRLRGDVQAARPDLDFGELPEVELGDGELAAYRVVTDLGGSRETSLIVAPRDPRLQPGRGVAADRDSGVLWSETAGGAEDRPDVAEILVASRLVPFDWDAYWIQG
jgi:hypothetical protein